MSKNKNTNFIDELVEEFGYDYVIGWCLCCEYDLRHQVESLDKVEDARKIEYLNNRAERYARRARRLIGERFNNEL